MSGYFSQYKRIIYFYTRVNKIYLWVFMISLCRIHINKKSKYQSILKFTKYSNQNPAVEIHNFYVYKSRHEYLIFLLLIVIICRNFARTIVVWVTFPLLLRPYHVWNAPSISFLMALITSRCSFQYNHIPEESSRNACTSGPYTGNTSGVTCFAWQLSRLSRRISGNIRLNFYFSISGLGRFLPTAARLPSRWRPLELFDRSLRTGTQVEISTNFGRARERRPLLYGHQGSGIIVLQESRD